MPPAEFVTIPLPRLSDNVSEYISSQVVRGNGHNSYNCLKNNHINVTDLSFHYSTSNVPVSAASDSWVAAGGPS